MHHLKVLVLCDPWLAEVDLYQWIMELGFQRFYEAVGVIPLSYESVFHGLDSFIVTLSSTVRPSFSVHSYVNSLETSEEITAIQYGMTLPDPYATELAGKLAVAQTQMQAIIARLGEAV